MSHTIQNMAIRKVGYWWEPDRPRNQWNRIENPNIDPPQSRHSTNFSQRADFPTNGLRSNWTFIGESNLNLEFTLYIKMNSTCMTYLNKHEVQKLLCHNKNFITIKWKYLRSHARQVAIRLNTHNYNTEKVKLIHFLFIQIRRISWISQYKFRNRVKFSILPSLLPPLWPIPLLPYLS